MDEKVKPSSTVSELHADKTSKKAENNSIEGRRRIKREQPLLNQAGVPCHVVRTAIFLAVVSFTFVTRFYLLHEPKHIW